MSSGDHKQQRKGRGFCFIRMGVLHPRCFRVFLASFAVFLLTACNFKNQKGNLEPVVGDVEFFSIQKEIIEPNCMSCHIGAGAALGIDFSSYAQIMESKSVIPYEPEQSKFFTTIESGRMPKGKLRLSEPEIKRVYQWIERGALEGAPSVPISSPTPVPTSVPKPTLASIQADFVAKRCVSCHQEALPSNRHVKLTHLFEVIEGNGPSGHVRKLIKPGCPKQSFFLSIMKERKMPPAPAEKASAEWLKAIDAWITSLQPNAGPLCDDEPGGD